MTTNPLGVLSNIFKNKRSFVFILIFFVILLAIPTYTQSKSLAEETPKETALRLMGIYGNGEGNSDNLIIEALRTHKGLSLEDAQKTLNEAKESFVKKTDNTLLGTITGQLAGLATKIALALPAMLFLIINVIAAFFADLAAALTTWAISPSFTNLSYTNPSSNEIIKAGLNITQGLVNMMLVMVLIYIAITTILRIAGYETKKLLATFVIIALLVNFAPIICGVIVDGSNIAMNFFLTGAQEGGMKPGKTFAFDRAQKAADQILPVLEQFISFENNAAAGLAQETAKVFISSIVNFMFAMVYLGFAVIFILRRMMIWMLVILSPIAFASYVLPVTKKIWDFWINQFMQWSMIGIGCGFFLYLAEFFNSKMGTLLGEAPADVPEFMGNIMMLFIPVMFLIVGLIVGLQTSAMGAGVLTGLTQKAALGIAKGGYKAPLGLGKWAARNTWQKGIKPGLEQGKFGKIPLPKTKDWATGISKQWEKIPVARWFLPDAVRKYGQYKPQVDEAQKEWKDYASVDIAHRLAAGAETGTRKTAGMMELIDRGDFQDFFNAYKDKYGIDKNDPNGDRRLFEDLSKEEENEIGKSVRKEFQQDISRSLDIAFQSGNHSKLIRSDPRLAKVWAGSGARGIPDPNDVELALSKGAGEARTGHIRNWDGVVADLDVVEKLLPRGREPFEAIDRELKKGVPQTMKSIDILFSEFIDNQLSHIDASLHGKVTSGNATKEETTKAWGKFEEAVEEQYGSSGYFQALKSGGRLKDRGFREGRYIAEGHKDRTVARKKSVSGLTTREPSIINAEVVEEAVEAEIIETPGDAVKVRGKRKTSGKGRNTRKWKDRKKGRK